MQILLLSCNRVVQELVRLGINGVENASLEIVENVEEIRGDQWDLLLVDERFAEASDHLISARKVLLGESKSDTSEYSTVLSKPFLPRDIRKLLETPALSEESRKNYTDNLQNFLKEESIELGETEVLDREEILRIREMLDEAEGITGSGTEAIPANITEPEEQIWTPDELIDLFESCRSKKLKKLLKGATIRISIEFPKEG